MSGDIQHPDTIEISRQPDGSYRIQWLRGLATYRRHVTQAQLPNLISSIFSQGIGEYDSICDSAMQDEVDLQSKHQY